MKTILKKSSEIWNELKEKYGPPPSLMCYLAGPMEYATDNGFNWRIHYQRLLYPLNITCVIPNFEEAEILKDVKQLKYYKKENLSKYIEIMRKFIEKDLEFVEKSDFVIVKWDGEITSGTVGEVQQAYLLKKPAYLVTSKSFHEIPGWFLACFTQLFHTEEELVSFIRVEYKR
jgi:nucleoside 2-deoxyribosyltransferase